MGVRRAPGPLPLLQQPPPPHRPPLRQRVMGCPTTSAVSSAGRKMRSWANSQPFPLFFMPIPTFPLSNRTTQVSLEEIPYQHLQVIVRPNSKAFFKISFTSLLDIKQMLNISPVTDWASRCKQIMKIWRKVSAADKVPYLVGSLFLV